MARRTTRRRKRRAPTGSKWPQRLFSIFREPINSDTVEDVLVNNVSICVAVYADDLGARTLLLNS